MKQKAKQIYGSIKAIFTLYPFSFLQNVSYKKMKLKTSQGKFIKIGLSPRLVISTEEQQSIGIMKSHFLMEMRLCFEKNIFRYKNASARNGASLQFGKNSIFPLFIIPVSAVVISLRLNYTSEFRLLRQTHTGPIL